MSWVPINDQNTQPHTKSATLPDLLHAINANMASKELELQTQYDVLCEKACASADSRIHHAQQEASAQVARAREDTDEIVGEYQREIEAQSESHAELARSHAELAGGLVSSAAELDGLRFAYNLVIDSYGAHLREELQSKQDEISRLTRALDAEKESHNRAIDRLNSQQALREELQSKQDEITRLTRALDGEKEAHNRAIGLLTKQLEASKKSYTNLVRERLREGSS